MAKLQISDVFSKAWDYYKGNALYLILGMIVFSVIGIAAAFILVLIGTFLLRSMSGMITTSVILIAFAVFMGIGYMHFVFLGYKTNDLDLRNLIPSGGAFWKSGAVLIAFSVLSLTVPMIILFAKITGDYSAMLSQVSAIVLSIVMLVIFIRYILVFFMYFEGADFVEAFGASAKLMKGNALTAIGLLAIFTLMNAVSSLLIVMPLFVAPFIAVACCVAYQELNGDETEPETAETEPAFIEDDYKPIQQG